MSIVSKHLYLEVASGDIRLVGFYNEDEIAELVMALICGNGNDWVRLRSSNHSHWSTEWTVLERNSDDIPTHIGCQEFDGELEIISTGV